MIGCQGTRRLVLPPYRRCMRWHVVLPPACWYENNLRRDSTPTCVKAGRVEMSPDFSPWVQNMWLVTLLRAGSPYSFRETPPSSSSASCAFGALLGHRQPSLCVSSFSPSQNPWKAPRKLFTCPNHPNSPISNLFCINNVFSYSPFSIAIVKYSTMINLTDFQIWKFHRRWKNMQLSPPDLVPSWICVNLMKKL